MTTRAQSELLLVGSLPADSTEEALRAGGELFGDMVFALPDGETGPRAAWVGYERERLVRPHPDIETVQETGSPTGIPRHAYETPVFKIREGVTELRLDSWPRIDDAIESYELFRELRQQGVIPAHVRFQVGLPFPSSALNGFKADFARDYPIAEPRASRSSSRRELAAADDGDPGRATSRSSGTSATRCSTSRACMAWMGDGAWERLRGPVTRLHAADPRGGARRLPPLLRHVPRVADVRGARHGAHRADGELRRRELRPHRRLAAPGRPALPAQRGRRASSGRSRTSTPGDTRVFLGIVLPVDGDAGPAPPPRDRVEVPRRLRRRDVLRVRPPARRGRRWRRCASTAAWSRRFAADGRIQTLVVTKSRLAELQRRRLLLDPGAPGPPPLQVRQPRLTSLPRPARRVVPQAMCQCHGAASAHVDSVYSPLRRAGARIVRDVLHHALGRRHRAAPCVRTGLDLW